MKSLLNNYSFKNFWWPAICFILFFQTIGAYLYYTNIFSAYISGLIYTGIKILLILLPLIFFFTTYKKKSSQRKDIVLYKKSLLWGILSGAIMGGLLLGVFIIFQDYFIQFGPLVKDKVNDLGLFTYYIYFAIFLSFFHSLIEEVYWRWFVIEFLHIRLKSNVLILISACGFTLHHILVLSQMTSLPFIIIGSFGVFIAGYFWGWLYKHTHTLIGSWISHIIVDCALMYIGYLLLMA